MTQFILFIGYVKKYPGKYDKIRSYYWYTVLQNTDETIEATRKLSINTNLQLTVHFLFIHFFVQFLSISSAVLLYLLQVLPFA